MIKLKTDKNLKTMLSKSSQIKFLLGASICIRYKSRQSVVLEVSGGGDLTGSRKKGTMRF